MKQKTALIMAGGTGGHIFPGLAVAQALRERGWRVHWLGAPGSMESRIVPAQGFVLETIDFSGVRGKGLKTLALLPWRLARAFWQARQVVRRVRPDVVVGLGGSVEKLHWLPEAHTDFLLAVIGEEFGLVGVIALIVLFFWMVRRIMHIGRQAIALDRVFAGLVAQGVAMWMGFQAFINMGVNLGALPTKGLTLPLMSFGGSAILMNLVAIAVVLRVDYENKLLMRGGHA